MRALNVCCALVVSAGVALAQQGREGSDALGVPPLAEVGGGSIARDLWDCPPGSACGQEWDGVCGSMAWWFYSDLDFCSPSPTTCKRVRCENFPPPGVPALTEPITRITWIGLYADDSSDGCYQGLHRFRIQFYEDEGGAPKDPTTPYYSEYVYATAEELGPTETLCFGCQPTPILRFTAVLSTPVALGTGWFSIAGANIPGCYHLWGGSIEGDNKFYGWYEEGGTIPGPPVTQWCDLNYCFLDTHGACCYDCASVCWEDVTALYCDEIGGRFLPGATCPVLTPPCGDARGACCFDDGECKIMTCWECGWELTCIGDLNCDWTIDFGDINPFVLYLSNEAVWQATYPGCRLADGDINCDGVYGQGSFQDINPFVALMTQCGTGCACPGPIICGSPRAQGNYWAGAGTTCDDCCTVVVPMGATLEDEPDDCAVPDTFNGGCNMDSPAFSIVTPGQPIYGESATFGGTRDTDWYTFTLPGPRTFTVTVEAEFDVMIEAFRKGPNPAAPCDGHVDVADPVTGAKCTQVVLQTRCLPGGDYIVVVAPASFSGVPCRADYRVTLAIGSPCEVLNTCGNCPGGADYIEGTPDGGPAPGYCQYNPDDPTDDPENGGCNVTPPAFELLPYDDTISPHTFTFCGKLWANQGERDFDWYGLELTSPAQVHWQVMSEVPCRATMLFNYWNGVHTPPSGCASYYYWEDTLCEACVPKTWTGTAYYDVGFYWFLVMPEDARGPLGHGYPCPVGSADFGNDYAITMTVLALPCACEPQLKPHSNTEPADDPPCPADSYDDTYNSGCDVSDPSTPGPRLPLGVGVDPIWVSRTGTWYTDPNDPATFTKDYDWYEFTVTATRRFKVYLFACFAATWEIWRQNDCDYGPIEGFQVPWCCDMGVYTLRCYPPGTYWLRVYPTAIAQCGKEYWLALTEPISCAVCNFACVGTDLDGSCDDIYLDDTNAGCDDPNGTPPHFMSFVANTTYCGRSYAGLQNGAPYYDPDWFTVTQTVASPRKFQVDIFAEFRVHLECYTSCDNYPDAPIAGLDFITPYVGVACPNGTAKSTALFPQNTVIYCRVTIVDQFGDLLTKYYPCAKGWNRWRLIPRLMAT